MKHIVKVTIGIPVYNSGKYLKNAIDSVLAQTFQDFEIIISIDGSSDDSAEIVSRYSDYRIHLIAENKNRGIAYRLNEQVNLAKGEYYARMDADDIMFPDRIEKQLNFMVENPGIDVTGSQALVMNEKNDIIGFRESDLHFTRKTILKKILFIHPTVFGKTSWFKNNPYTHEFDGVEDFYLWNSTYSYSTFRILSEPLLFYRDSPVNNVSTYLKRQNKLRKAIKKLNKSSIVSISKFYELYLSSLLKTTIYVIFSKLGLSGMLVRNRNKTLGQEKMSFYSTILQSLINQK
jgi:glycosyltransferase involved in cell wall biosynthesis